MLWEEFMKYLSYQRKIDIQWTEINVTLFAFLWQIFQWCN